MMLSIQELAALHPRALKAILMLHQMPTTAAAPLTSRLERRRHGGDGAQRQRVGWRRPTRNPQRHRRRWADATELARSQESLTAFLHRQAWRCACPEVDSAALHFLIRSLNDDGYLEESLQELAIALAGPDDLEQIDELVHPLHRGQRLLQTLEPVGVGARNLAECLTLQLSALAADAHSGVPPDVVQTALQICQQPLKCWPAAMCAASPRPAPKAVLRAKSAPAPP